jgi:hypothetical protein
VHLPLVGRQLPFSVERHDAIVEATLLMLIILQYWAAAFVESEYELRRLRIYRLFIHLGQIAPNEGWS